MKEHARNSPAETWIGEGGEWVLQAWQQMFPWSPRRRRWRWRLFSCSPWRIMPEQTSIRQLMERLLQGQVFCQKLRPMGHPHWINLFLKDCTLWKGPFLEKFLLSYIPWKGPTSENFMKYCVLWAEITVRQMVWHWWSVIPWSKTFLHPS